MPEANPYYAGPRSDHFDGLRFFNPGQRGSDRSMLEVLRWKLRFGAASWPRHVPIRPARPLARVEGLRVTMVGHATLLIQAAGRNLLTDPVWSQRASPLRFAGPMRATAPGIAFEDLPTIDTVLLSHNHYDHLDLATLARLHARDAPLIVTPLGNDAIVRGAIAGARVVTGDWGDRVALDGGATVDIVAANHWSSRGISDRRMALWGGFMLRTSAGLIYFAGDTGYGEGALFRALRADYGTPDLALLPIGAYAPRWFMAPQHADPSEAVRILLDLNARAALGIHWGTFQLTDEPREEPARLLRSAAVAAGLDPTRFIAAEPGTVWQP